METEEDVAMKPPLPSVLCNGERVGGRGGHEHRAWSRPTLTVSP